MEERAEGLDAGFQQSVDEAMVEVEPMWIDRVPVPVGKTRDQEMEKRKDFQSHPLHQGDVFGVAVVEVVGDVAGIAVEGLARECGRRCPRWMGRDRLHLYCAFDLVGCCCRTPEEARRKAARRIDWTVRLREGGRLTAGSDAAAADAA